MKHISLFSGLGGFDLACDWAGIPTIVQVEIDPFCQKVLKKHWPNVPIVEDVNDVEEIKKIVANATGEASSPRTDFRTLGEQEQEQLRGSLRSCVLLTAGFPCQPFSAAGRRRGKADDRYLWPQTIAVIEGVKPDWVLLENVAGLLSMVFPDGASPVASQATLFSGQDDEIADYDTISGGIDRDLRQAGYETVWLVIPACGVGAPHRRDRVWVVANTQQPSDRGKVQCGQVVRTDTIRPTGRFGRPDSDATNSSQQRLQEREMLGRDIQSERPSTIRDSWQENWYEVATRFCRVDDGLPRGLDEDRVNRLKALGNAIVPQVAYQIIKAIIEGDSQWQ